MATAQFIHDGNSIDYRPIENLPAGYVVAQNDLIGITKVDIAAGQLGALAVTGVFDLPKATGATTAVAVGEKLHWNAVAKQATKAEDNGDVPPVKYPYLGKAARAAGNDDETVRVRLQQ